MPYVAWVTRRFMEDNWNGRTDYESYEIEHYEADTPSDLITKIANDVYYREVTDREQHRGYDFSPIFHTDSGESLTLDMLRNSATWRERQLKDAVRKAIQEDAARNMLAKSEAHTEMVERAEYERLKAKFDTPT